MKFTSVNQGNIKRKLRKRQRKTRKLLKKIKNMAGYGQRRVRERENTDPEDLPSSLYPTSPMFESPALSDCQDIRGVDRACCNSALRCFRNLETTLNDLDPTQSSSDTFQACRKVREELRRDKLCVKSALSRCNGSGRLILQHRFDTKINTLYDQLYKQCARTPSTPSQVTEITKDKPGPGPHFTTTPNVQEKPQSGSNVSTGSAGIIAGAVAGSFVIIAVILILFLCYRRKRSASEASNSSGGSSSQNLFDVKRPPNPFVRQTPPTPLSRTESNQYAEIDERFVDPSYKPALPPYPAPPRPFVNTGYQQPENDVILSNEERARRIQAAQHNVVHPISTITGETPNYLELDRDTSQSYYEEPIERRPAFERSYADLNRDTHSSVGYTQPEINYEENGAGASTSGSRVSGFDNANEDLPMRYKFAGAVESSSSRDSAASNKSAPHTYFVLESTNV